MAIFRYPHRQLPAASKVLDKIREKDEELADLMAELLELHEINAQALEDFLAANTP